MSSFSPVPEPPFSIVILTRALEIGGAERQIVHLARGLAQRGHRVAVAVFYAGGALEAELAGSGAELVDLAKRGRWDVLAFLGRLVAMVRARRPDVVYTFLSGGNALSGLLRGFFPPLALVWGVRASNMDLSRYDWLSRAMYRLESRLSRRADRIVSNSQAGLDYAVANGFPAGRMTVIENGIDTASFRPDPAARARTRAAWGVADDERLIGLLARLDPMKGHDTFLHSARAIAATEPAARFACIGDGPAAYRATLQRLAAGLGIAERVIWTGPTRDPVGALNALDVLCSASLFGEGFSNSICEALACGVPCVVTDVGDSARIVDDPRRVVPPGDASALAGALCDALGQPDRRALRARIVEHYSLERMVARSEALLAELTTGTEAGSATRK